MGGNVVPGLLLVGLNGRAKNGTEVGGQDGGSGCRHCCSGKSVVGGMMCDQWEGTIAAQILQ